MRKLNKKILYVVMALAALALLIPAMGVPVSAAPAATPHLNMFLIDPITGTNTTPDSGFDITGSKVHVVPVDLGGLTVLDWTITNFDIPVPGHADSVITANATGAEGTAFADVRGGFGPTVITADLSNSTSIYIDKKFAQIDNTVISPNLSIPVTWVEADKTFTATANVSDTVNGIFVSKDGNLEPMPVQGVILHWYLIDGNAASNMGGISMAQGFESTVESYIAGLPRAFFTTFAADGITIVTPTEAMSVTGANGMSSVTLNATGEEPVDVVVVPEYPNLGNVLVTPEMTKVNFWTQEMEKVPQVRWAGEKIVLEKNWGDTFDTTTSTGPGNFAVKFSLENQSPGTLGMVGPNMIGPFAASNFINSTQTVWAPVEDGVSSVLLECQDEGVVSVTATLYTLDAVGNMVIVNQHGFVVYFLKLESLTLGNVVGKRANEDSGLFEPSNPWDASLDVVSENLTVSTDALLRARVKGWFTSSNPTTRPAGAIDINNTPNNPNDDLLLPQGRWVLPDDWPMLAGSYNWQEMRLHWDIMDNPMDTVMSPYNDPSNDTAIKTPLDATEGNWGTGNYYMYAPNSFTGGTLVAAAPVIGPFSPGIELMTPTGWAVPFTSPDPLRQMTTVVPNGVLDWWDAPMPPAKITFEINNVSALNTAGVNVGNAGYFKTAMKTDIYYVMSPTGVKFYTNPFYQEMIPAHEWIPAFINNGGYDWNSFDLVHYGPYPFWYIINRLAGVVPTTNMDYPTKVQVYSDNHGEAMVYVNGDWNLNRLLWTPNGLDIPFGTTVGNTVIQAAADYPYFRVHQAIWSNLVAKTWTWSGEVLQTVLSVGDYGNVSGTAPNEIGTSNKKLVLVWATDRDGKIDGVLGTKVQWNLDPAVGVSISTDTTTIGISNYNATMQAINVNNGFLDVAPGTILDGGARFHGVSYLMQPSAAEMTLFAKLYPSKDPTAYAVAGIALVDASGTNHMGTKDTFVTEILTGPDFAPTTLIYAQNVNFTLPYPLDDNILAGDANNDGVVSMADVTAVERMILGLTSANIMADANAKDGINMGDVVKIERTILGLK